MAGWHHWLNGREFEWTPGVGDGQGGLVCCDSWGHKESDTTERLNWTETIVPIGNGWSKTVFFLPTLDSRLLSMAPCCVSWQQLLLEASPFEKDSVEAGVWWVPLWAPLCLTRLQATGVSFSFSSGLLWLWFLVPATSPLLSLFPLQDHLPPLLIQVPPIHSSA